jgi:hypothetical protein
MNRLFKNIELTLLRLCRGAKYGTT